MSAMATVYIDATSETQVTRYRNPKELYDSDDTQTSWTIRGLSEIRTSHYIEADFDVDKHGHYYLLYAVWNTGNSFGNSDGYYFEPIDLYKTKSKAKAALEKLNESPSSNVAVLETESGKQYDYTKPWLGYFDSLEELRVVPVEYD
jgi:hypothetical protein